MAFDWTDQRRHQLALLLEQHHSWESAAAVLSDLYRVDPPLKANAVRMMGRRLGLKSGYETGQKRPPIIPPAMRTFDGAWSLQEDGGWMITGDWHVPYVDWLMVARMARVASVMGIRNLMIAGDLYNFDAVSRHPKPIQTSSMDQDRRAARTAIDLMLQAFERIRIISGNHDLWWARKNDGLFAAETVEGHLLRFCRGDDEAIDRERLDWSIYGYCQIETASGPWRITHPGQFSRNRGMTARRLSAKYESHVITFHEHHLDASVSDNKKYCAYACGILADPNKMAYVRLVDTDKPEMVRGFAALKDGVCTLFGETPGFTNWKTWGIGA